MLRAPTLKSHTENSTSESGAVDGFRFANIKILLASHAHSDHVAGHALIKQLTGARVEVMEGDANVISSGGKGQCLYNEGWKPCAVDRVLKDGDTVTLDRKSVV